jgi:hypothetical protein
VSEQKHTDLAGNPLRTHSCEPRSGMAQAFVQIVRMDAGGGRGAWQFVQSAQQMHFSIAIQYCPFCGVDLERAHRSES